MALPFTWVRKVAPVPLASVARQMLVQHSEVNGVPSVYVVALVQEMVFVVLAANAIGRQKASKISRVRKGLRRFI